jgi:hypothetical protein
MSHRAPLRVLGVAAALALSAAAPAACGRDQGGSAPPARKETPMAQQQTPQHSGDAITIMKVRPQTEQKLMVRSSVFQNGGFIPDRYSAYGDNVSPPLEWNAIPQAKAFALIVEDPDAPRAEPFLHWTLWNIPEGTTSLPEGLPAKHRLEHPQGAEQGENGSGSIGWFGPRPPEGHGVHHYHFQVFALSTRLEMPPTTPFNELLNALKGHVLAEGETVGLYERKGR